MSLDISNVNIVIGSWGSYNECNEKALGSKWIALADYNNWEEIEEELAIQGFDLNGIDEELFIQDVEGFPTDEVNWDYTHPKDFFELLLEADVLTNDSNYDTMCAFLELRSYDEFRERVQSNGSNWTEDIYIYKGYSWEDYGHEMFDMCVYNFPSELENFFDYEAYGKYMGDCYAEEYSDGIVEIR